jgi:cell wall-associated NlpC family hydrolase
MAKYIEPKKIESVQRTGDGEIIVLNQDYPVARYQIDDRRFTSKTGFKVELYYRDRTKNQITGKQANQLIKVDLTDHVVSLDWSESIDDFTVSGNLVLHDPVHPTKNERLFQNIDKGQRLKISIINNNNQMEELGRYVIWSKSRGSRTDSNLSLEFKDPMVYLHQSEDTFLFQRDPKKKAYKKGWTAAQITRFVCDKYGIPVAKRLPVCKNRNPLIKIDSGSVYELLLKVWTEERRISGRKFVIRFEKDILRVFEKKEQPVLYSIQEGQNLISTSFTDTLDGMFNAVTVISEPQDSDNTQTTTDRTVDPGETRNDPYAASGGGWQNAAASFYTDIGQAVSCAGVGPRTAEQMGFAELSTNWSAPSGWDFKALGNLSCGAEIEVRYNGKTVRVPKIDVGRGGAGGSTGYDRKIDLTSAAWDALSIPRSAGIVAVEWRKATGSSVEPEKSVIVEKVKNQAKIDKYGYLHKLIKLDKAITKNDAKKQALQVLRSNLTENLNATVSCFLMPRLRAGQPVFVRDHIGARLIGKFYTSSVSHSIAASGATTDIDLNWLDVVPSALLTDEDKGIKASTGGTGGNCANTAIEAGRAVIGTPYSWGGGGTNGASKGIGRGAGTIGFDCSGFIQYCWAKAGVSLPRHTDALAKSGVGVPLGQEQPGDILLYNTSDGAGSKYGHVAMHTAPGMIINSGGAAGGGVREYARSDHVLVRRVTQMCPKTGTGGGGGGGFVPPADAPTPGLRLNQTAQYNPLLSGTSSPVGEFSPNRVTVNPGGFGFTSPAPIALHRFREGNAVLEYNGKTSTVEIRKATRTPIPGGVDLLIGPITAQDLGIKNKPLQKIRLYLKA